MSIRLLLVKDFENSEDETIRVYAKSKWKLITTWFNLLSFGYIPVCIYCDLRELTENGTKHLKMFMGIRDFLFTSFVLPTTAFADILFWRLWYHDRELMFPQSVDNVIYYWEQHSLHTLSLVFVIFDLLFVRRERPKSMVPGIVAMLGFISIYIAVCVHSVANEEYLYPVLKKFSPSKLLVLTIYTLTSVLFYHTGQWLVIDFIHGHQRRLKKNV
ncbi:jg12424 [Pararge aegeria aegeria]|uniref:Jg12424 protein n=1 Tax=Pararge aegeria aegeria TaxID=348720 RepID=A0A8S4RDE6_9NEOP|nr:jg12424 [Pararge aegeria aegeria]